MPQIPFPIASQPGSLGSHDADFHGPSPCPSITLFGVAGNPGDEVAQSRSTARRKYTNTPQSKATLTRWRIEWCSRQRIVRQIEDGQGLKRFVRLWTVLCGIGYPAGGSDQAQVERSVSR